MTPDLFDVIGYTPDRAETIADGAVILRGFALPRVGDILHSLDAIARQSPFRRMVTPGGYPMTVAMTNCGEAGWVTDRRGYRYDRTDPLTGNPWPAMPLGFRELAAAAAAELGYPTFQPDACLVNRYEPGAAMSLHQDRNECDFSQPIVSVSLGLPATFQFGGLKRTDPVKRSQLHHGDVVVWGGRSRLFHHGVSKLKEGMHAVLGPTRLNLTFRRATSAGR